MIQLKRLNMYQDHAMTLELTNDSNGRNNNNNNNKDKQQPWLKLKAIPSKIDAQNAMWEKCQKISDPEKPTPP
jgi:hypothetical protein